MAHLSESIRLTVFSARDSAHSFARTLLQDTGVAFDVVAEAWNEVGPAREQARAADDAGRDVQENLQLRVARYNAYGPRLAHFFPSLPPRAQRKTQ